MAPHPLSGLASPRDAGIHAPMTDTVTPRASGGRLVSGAAWNALGRGLPLLVALALTPVLVNLMGLERWGLFTLALALVGVFGVFDLGVGAALTRTLAARIGAGETGSAAELASAAISALFLLSLVIAGAAFALVPLLVERVLNVPPALQAEAVNAFRLLTAAAPLIVVNAALWGALAAHGRFREANLVMMPVSLMYYVGPALVLLLWQSLTGVVLALVACRLVNTLSYLWLVRRDLPGLRPAWPHWGTVAPLLRMGGWMSASGVLTQALLYADRFLVGAVLTLAAVAFYATPLDLVMRMWILPVAVSQALMPALAASYLTAPGQTASLLRRGALLVMAGVIAPCLVLVAGAGDILHLWLGAEFAQGGARVLQILSVGIFFSCAAFAPGALLDAIGRPDVNAKWQLAQAVLYLPLAAAALWLAGIEGAAAAWAVRAAIDCFGRLYFCARLYPAVAAAARRLALPLAAGGTALAALLPFADHGVLAGIAAVGLLGFLAAAARVLTPEERADARVLLRRPWAVRGMLRGRGA